MCTVEKRYQRKAFKFTSTLLDVHSILLNITEELGSTLVSTED